MRQITWLVLSIAIIAPVAFWYFTQGRTETATLAGAGLTLTNRPATFCPETAKIVAIKSAQEGTVHFEGDAVIAGCDSVRLPTEQLTEAVQYQIFALIDGARAMRVVAVGPITNHLPVALQLGDVNADNVINEIDRHGLELALSVGDRQGEQFDVDGDKEVTILDYSLVVMNQGAGVNRPDGKLWGAL